MSAWKITREHAEAIADKFVSLAADQAGQPYTVEHAASVSRIQVGLALDHRDQLERIETLLVQIRDRFGGVAPVVDIEAERRRREEEEAEAALAALPPGVREALMRKAAGGAS